MASVPAKPPDSVNRATPATRFGRGQMLDGRRAAPLPRERGPTFQERPSRERIWRIGPSGATQAGRSSAQPALSQPYSLAHRGHMTAEQQLKKLNKIHLGTVTHGFHTRTVLKVAKGSVTALDFLPADRQVVIWSGHPPIRPHYLGATTTVST